MNPKVTKALCLALCLLAAAACDRRRTQPPDASDTTDSTIAQPPATAVEAGREATPERSACAGLSGAALAECQAPRQGATPADRASAPVQAAPANEDAAGSDPQPHRAPEP